MLAGIFIVGGLDAALRPESKVPAALPVAGPIVDHIDALDDTAQLVRLDGAVKVLAGTMLALGKFPRLSSLALSTSLVPTTLAAHRFWQAKDPKERANQRIQFLKNLSMLGGLLLASVDTEGKPSVAWRARRAPDVLSHSLHDLRREARLGAHSTLGSLQDSLQAAAHTATDTIRDKLPA